MTPITFEIDDPLDLAGAGAVEVTVTLSTGERRWCFFLTPEAIRACGDRLDGDVRVHYGEPHMIVVSRLDASVIASALRDLAENDELVAHTAALSHA